MLHEDFQNIVLPSAVKMLKRNPEIVLESVGILLKSLNLDLSKYAVEILSVVSPQARHADEDRRVEALAIVRCLSQKSSNPDALEAMFNVVKSVIGGEFLIFVLLLFWDVFWLPTEETVVKEKIWSVVSQNEPSVIPISMASKLLTEDCMACVDLLELLHVEHVQRVLDSFSVKLLCQLMIFFICHSSWEIQRMTYDATRRIVPAAPQLADLLVEFTNSMSVVAEKLHLSKLSEAENLLEAQIPFLPSVEASVKALLVISSAALPATPSASMRV